MSEDRADGEIPETLLKPFFQLKMFKLGLKHHQSGKGSDLLFFKSQAGQCMGLRCIVVLLNFIAKRSPGCESDL